MKKFEPGKIYFTKLMTDNCLDPASLKVKVLSRTEKTVKVLFIRFADTQWHRLFLHQEFIDAVNGITSHFYKRIEFHFLSFCI